ncbi:MAG: hypothetical protein FJX71_05695 [Alphaproteobacteria bacterium]|nr:hypothetical protein [Alphaproteobacteria bacterium]
MKKIILLLCIFSFLNYHTFGYESAADQHAYAFFEHERTKLIESGKSTLTDLEVLDKENLRIQTNFQKAIMNGDDAGCSEARAAFEALIKKWTHLFSEDVN